jgi:beta-glucosidase
MLPYPECIAQGVATLMASYSSWNGGENARESLFADRCSKGQVRLQGRRVSMFVILIYYKHSLCSCMDCDLFKLLFQGFVVSDWEGIDELCEPRGSDYRSCIALAVNAGVDMVKSRNFEIK